jgi:hypothetical protein
LYPIDSYEYKGVALLKSSLLDSLDFVGHAFSTRRGGVSEGRYSSLNLGDARGEDPERVKENRKRFFGAADIEGFRIAEAQQVHGTEIVEINACHIGTKPCADALMTNVPGILVTVQTADCVPVLIADRKQRAVAAVHAGRRGTAAGFLNEVVRKLKERYGSEPPDLVAVLGPGISGPRYEVREECLPPFQERFADWRMFCDPHKGGKWLLDLPGAIRRQIIAAGVPAKQVGLSGPCTFSENSRFYSYRRDGPSTGRLMAAIAIR